MTRFADLHIHTRFSDSTDSPEEVLAAAQFNGVDCIAITDHDTFAGIAPCQALAVDLGVEVVPGIELSTDFAEREVHMLGYFVDVHQEKFLENIRLFQEARGSRIRQMIEKLRGLGVSNIEYDEVAALTCSGAVGRMHLATVLLQKGWVGDIRQAFDKYLGEEGPAYVPKWRLLPVEAIRLIKDAGGAAVLAHPMFSRCDELIPSLVQAGLDGIESYYPNCSPEIIRFYAQLAEKYGLVATGGSDSHGRIKPSTYVGKIKVPYEVVDQLRRRAGQ